MSEIEGVQLENLPVDYNALIEKQLAELQKRVAPASGDKIRIGTNKSFIFPDGTETKDPFECVIVDFVSSNEYYETGFDKDDISPPDCFARGPEHATLVPDESSPAKQAESCASCQQNVFGSAPRGKGKACKNSRLMAVLSPDATPESPIWLLQASPTAIGPFDKYITALGAQMNALSWGVITTIGFDPHSDYPSLRFARPTKLTPERAMEFYARHAEARKRLLQMPDVSQLAAKVNAPKSARRR